MELKPCPFCGGPAAIERIGTQRQSNIVACEDCGTRHESGETFNYGSGWNHRPIEDALRAELAAERARLEWALAFLVRPSRFTERRFLFDGDDGREIPAGQTARDVIDRLRREGGE